MKGLFVLLLLLQLALCTFSQITLDQPESTTVKPSDTLKLFCKVSVSVTSQHWAWIRQIPGKGLEYMGYLHSDGSSNPATSFQSQVSLTRDTSKNEIYFQMTNMKTEDSGKYYCARYTVTEGTEDWC
ncbi:hypothetical protein GDO86_001589 [Hymenochirus boettgeri]|uniref:Ig-like domain-containing protein n=1 Tax=Hymenochirus boettgeri TaxID=247094 RepID=A0A8T2KDE4_9PIPI|nr:hypothetical protein GDO86_001589 [Hymenochirus boettgeri]